LNGDKTSRIQERWWDKEPIANVRLVIEMAREHHKNVYLCFMDYLKAFDSAKHLKMWNGMRSIRIPKHLIVLKRDLCREQ
jgi:hypothetical protein